MLDILIPTCLPPDDISLRIQRKELYGQTDTQFRVLASCQNGSAAYNRNLCLKRCHRDVAIMLDDDVHGFYDGWERDLLAPLADLSVVIVSARLLTRYGTPSQTCSRCYDMEPDAIEVQPGRDCVLPTAAIAFRNIGVMFDEAFLGSGFEDSDWCFQYRKKLPGCKFVQSNRCKLVHLNEMKGQSQHWEANKALFENKWLGGTVTR